MLAKTHISISVQITSLNFLNSEAPLLSMFIDDKNTNLSSSLKRTQYLRCVQKMLPVGVYCAFPALLLCSDEGCMCALFALNRQH